MEVISCGQSVTCFATNYIALQSILNKKVWFKAIVYFIPDGIIIGRVTLRRGRLIESIVCNHSFRDRCRMVVNILEPVVRVLRMVDGDKKPTMGYIYESIEVNERSN